MVLAQSDHEIIIFLEVEKNKINSNFFEGLYIKFNLLDERLISS